jgi:vanillate O-demethylase monooxygenase subunit
MFPRNAWYVAAMAEEIGTTPLGRKVCNESIVIYRGPNGAPVALQDWCPHRGAPLSLGRVVDGQLVCGYHGLTMGCDGRAVAMPGQRVRGFPSVRTYPVVEYAGFIWLWPGDPAQATPARLPRLAWADNPEWAYGGSLYHVKGDYRLMIDNLMDLTHENYVHAGSIGQPEIDETPCETAVAGDAVTTSRFMSGIEAPPFWRMAMRAAGLPEDDPVDRWQICRFSPPSNVMIDVGVALQGHGGFDAPRHKKAYGIVVDFITPETETSMWYFWGMARNFRPEDAALTDQIREGQRKIFSEDLQMIERQQANLAKWPERQLLKLNIDAGGVAARKVIERLVMAEMATASRTS